MGQGERFTHHRIPFISLCTFYWVHVVHIQTDEGKHRQPWKKVLEPGRKILEEGLWGVSAPLCILSLVPSIKKKKSHFTGKSDLNVYLNVPIHQKSHLAVFLTGDPYASSLQTEVLQNKRERKRKKNNMMNLHVPITQLQQSAIYGQSVDPPTPSGITFKQTQDIILHLTCYYT